MSGLGIKGTDTFLIPSHNFKKIMPKMEDSKEKRIEKCGQLSTKSYILRNKLFKKTGFCNIQKLSESYLHESGQKMQAF